MELPGIADASPPEATSRSTAYPKADGEAYDILLVEDHEPTLAVLTKLLRRLNHRLTSVTSVAAARIVASEGAFDVMISDARLPDGSGLDLMRQVRDRYAGRAIALSGYGMEFDVAKSQAAGVAKHLTTPVDLAALEAATGRVAARMRRSSSAPSDVQAPEQARSSATPTRTSRRYGIG